MKVFTASNPTEAHIICGLLQSNGIQAEVKGDQLFGLQGEVPFDDSTAPSVWLVNANELKQKKANSVINDYLNTVSEEKAWVCSRCNEENEAQFGVCWNCGESH